jgi:hypothetical protein
MTMDIWHYHNKTDQLIGSDRVQLRNLMGYYGATVDHDEFPDDVYKPEYQDKHLRQGLAKATTEDEIGMAVFYATQMSGERIPELEPVLLQSRDRAAAVKYARDILDHNWPELEQLILDENEIDSALYYMDRLKKRSWPALAKKILALPDSTPDELKLKNRYSVSYAVKTRRRWPEAEPSILRQGYSTLRYIQYVIRAPWPEGERTLVKANYVRTYLADFPERTEAAKKWGYIPGD